MTHGPIIFQGVTKGYGDHRVLAGVGLTLEADTVTALTGPNGVGKTTLARLLLGLEKPDSGIVAGVEGLRRAAVFQEDRLCAHLDAVTNVRLVLDREQWDSAEQELALVGLKSGDLFKPVSELSGGQRRRVAIARALAVKAELVVLDEPFTGLDAGTKPAVMDYVRERLAGCTALVITHDSTEAAFLGARVVTLNHSPGLTI
ncbi:ATP-binding cassette domain-containing protein [Demequina sp.]|uniref:ATP-binding cassette domain-containing protein n=1 Tax=Demequina sp. TaxID=2050685 RepID=UPI0025BC7997|nr:ATP-binding cassette domain-containing protein [Demequina sp.]